MQPGDLLFTIDPRPYQAALDEAQARVERDRALAKNAEETAARYADLVKKDYVTPEQYEQMRAGGEAARATAKADEAAVENARLQLSYTRITAPIAGRTGSIQVHRGNMLRPNDERTLVTINQIRPIAVAFTVPESAFDADPTGPGGFQAVGRGPSRGLPRGLGRARRRAGVRRPGSGPAGDKPGPRRESFPSSTTPSTGRPARSVSRRPSRTASGALWPGRFVDVVLTLAHDPRRPRVPAEAIQTGPAGLLRLRRQGRLDGRVAARHRGRKQGGHVVIAKGLAADERVVTDGQLRLAPGVKVEVKPSAEVRS